METATLASASAEGKRFKTGGRMISLRFDDIVDKLKQMEEQESGEAWVEEEEEWEMQQEKLGKSRGKQKEVSPDGQAHGDEHDVDEECEPGLTPRPGEGSHIDDPETAQAKKRMNVLVEIAETETAYYRDLEILNSVLLASLFWQDHDLSILFFK
jgi:hypothetical protein